MRHTFASRLVQQGLPLYDVMHMTGHKSLAMVQRYSHLAPEFQERAIVALNSYGHDLGTLGIESPKEDETHNGQNPKVSLGVLPKNLVEPIGIEPTTSTLPVLRSPN